MKKRSNVIPFPSAETRGERPGKAGRQPVVLVTGSTSEIGKAIVGQFREEGWRVIAVSRHSFLDECSASLTENDHVHADLRDLGALDRFASDIRSRLQDGYLDAVVNNARLSPRGPDLSRQGVLGTDANTWQDVLNVNLVSVALLAKNLLPELRAAGGAIVNVSSVAASTVHPLMGAAYAASKAGLGALTRELAYEFASHGIRVNSVMPAEMEGPFLNASEYAEFEVNPLAEGLSLPTHIARAIIFLCSEHSAHINGSEIRIDTGLPI